MPNGKDLDKQDLSLHDERRVKTLSPGAMTARRFFRNRLAVAGLVILAGMFLFSFLGGALIPYSQQQVFYREEIQLKEFAAVRENREFRFMEAEEGSFPPVLQAQFTLAQGKKEQFFYQNVPYSISREGKDFYSVSREGELVGIAYQDILAPAQSFSFTLAALRAYTAGREGFTAEGRGFTLQGNSILEKGEAVATISRWLVQNKVGEAIPQPLQETLIRGIREEQETLIYGDREFYLSFDAASGQWSVREGTAARVWDSYAPPSAKHPLGTDKNGMDMLTRLMYGGRVSLVIGFIVVAISGLLGVVMGGVAGYFGGWVDNLVMRAVDIFYCIPSTPLLIILGAAMDAMRVEPQLRMLLLMLILGVLGWSGIARLVRGQILSLREQEFMLATESSGLRIYRRIFRHLLPNVIPQLIVTCTMSLGSTILTEATLSFLGLGVKFPFASWGNIMNDVSNSHVLTSYWFVWIPAGVCLVLSVLGFNFVGDGLRDAFDPKMKR